VEVRRQSRAATKAQARWEISAEARQPTHAQCALVQNALQYDSEERATVEMMKRCTMREDIIKVGSCADLAGVT
jgi:hypothetical protein